MKLSCIDLSKVTNDRLSLSMEASVNTDNAVREVKMSFTEATEGKRSG